MSDPSLNQETDSKNENSDESKGKPFSFPLEIRERIISFCDVKTIYLLMQTCKHFNEISKKNQIWKMILEQLRVQNEPFSYFSCCMLAVFYQKAYDRKIDFIFFYEQKTLVIHQQAQIFLPFLVCDKNILDMKSHDALYFGPKLFIGMKNNSILIYEFDAFSMTLIGSIPNTNYSYKWFGQFDDDYLLTGNHNSFMVIQLKSGFQLQDALKIQAQSVVFDPLKKTVFYIQENKLNCMFCNGKEPVTNTVEIPFKNVLNGTLQLKGLFVFVVVPQTVILIFKKKDLQFLSAIPIIYNSFNIFSSSLICFGNSFTYNIFKKKYCGITPIQKSSPFLMRAILSKFNLRSVNAINEYGYYSNNEKECIWWAFM